MRCLFPAIRPYARERLVVGDGHQLYLEQCGNPDGLPVLFIHGGPGAGITQRDRQFFDPERYRVILFDQRGAGQSQPHASLAANTTDHLIADIEQIRHQLGISQWVLFGGSWGSTLALAYAQTHPAAVIAMVLRGIFLCRDEDIAWFYQCGASRIFAEHWRDFLAPIPLAEQHDLLSAYYRRLTASNELERMAAAKAWSIWEGRCAALKHNPEIVGRLADPHLALAMARIEAHYFYHRAFLDQRPLLHHCQQLADIPGYIVHGRYDMVCPVDQAIALQQAWPVAQLAIVNDAGHASSEPGIVDALIHATERIADRFYRGAAQ